MKLSYSLVHKAGSVAVAATLFAFALGPLSALADSGSITIDSINGQPPTGHCIAGPLTIVVSGVTGSQGGPYSVDVGDGGTSATSTTAIVSGSDTTFNNVTLNTFTPTQGSNELIVYLYHGSPSGDDSHLTVVNQCVAAPTQGVVTVVKNVDGGTAMPSDFTLHIGGNSFPGSSGFGKDNLLTAGSYTVTEDANANYTRSYSGDCDSSGNITVVAGNNYTCTLTNTENAAPPPQNGVLEIVKHVSGSEASPSSFSFSINGGTATTFNANGTNDVSEAAGSYSVTETADAAYTTTYSNSANANTDCSNLAVASSATTICTITNTFIVVPPPPSADLSVTKGVDNPSPFEGADVVYTLTVHNAGPNDATGVSATDQLPAGVTYVSDDSIGSAYNSGTGVWTIGTLTNGSDAVLHITAQVNTLSQTTNTATVTSNVSDPTPSNNTSNSVNVTAVCPVNESNVDGQCVAPPSSTDLSVAKVIDNESTPVVGQTVTYTVTATNNGPDDATNVIVTDLLPSVLTYTSSTPSQGSYDSNTGVWTVGSLSASANATLEIAATVGTNEAGLDITNNATISGDQSDSNSNNNNASASFTAACPTGEHADADNVCVQDTGTLTIVKHTTGGDGTFSFSIPGQDDVILSTEDGAATSSDITLNTGTYDVTENVPDGWDFSGVSCHYDNESVGNAIQNGEAVVLDNGDHVTCTFSDAVHVNGNTPPVADDQSVTTPKNTSIAIDLTGSDADNDPITFAIVSGPAHGTLSGTAPNVIYVPPPGDTGSDSFTFKTNDGQADSNVATVSITITGGSNGGGGGGGGSQTSGSGGGGGGSVLGASTEGQVLGESCGVYMNKHLRLGSSKNDPDQTKKLQEFMNQFENAGLPVTGFYGPLTTAAVKAFQAKYGDDILKPWGITTPTGIVYFTTLHKINQLECPALTQALDELVPWSLNPNAQ